MSLETISGVREVGIGGMNSLYRPEYNIWDAGYGRFSGGVFGRDILIALKLAFSRPSNIRIPYFLQRAEAALDFLAQTQGTEYNTAQDEREGAIIHEYRNGFTPPEVVEDLKRGGFPFDKKENGEEEMKYYGANDVTGMFIGVVHDLGEMKGLAVGAKDSKEYIQTRDDYYKKMWPSVKAAFEHQFELAKSSGHNLIDSIPQNIQALFNHTEADSDFSYRREDGLTPRPPYIFLQANSHFLEAMVKIQPMAKVNNDEVVLEKAQERHQKGSQAFRKLFWMPDEKYYSPLIDGEGQQVKIIRADPIEALWCGILEQAHADRVIDRLLEPDMYIPRMAIRSRSSNSTQFRVNGPYAYWNGAVWTHQLAKAAIGFERYGRYKEAQMMDEILFALVAEKGAVEVLAVTEDGRLLDYRERRIVRACNPQFFAAAAILARTAEID